MSHEGRYNPQYNFHLIDAGRVAQNMQLTAWNHKVGSGLFTGIREEKFRSDFEIPDELSPTIVVGFGYPYKDLSKLSFIRDSDIKVNGTE
jgi:nitroreductase